MTTTILGVVAAICLALAIYAFFRSQELATENQQNKESVTRLERDLKKLQSTLDTQTKKLSKKSGEASKKKSKAAGKQQRLDQQQSQLQKLRAELKESQDKVQNLSRDLNRVRIDREETRQKLVAAEERVSQATPDVEAEAPRAVAQQSAPRADEAPAADNDAPKPERKKSLGKIERDMERAEADRAKAFDRVERYKKALVARESELRNLRRRNEHNRRAYIITQLQLDLANDELYVMQHGEPPPYKQADKRAKRAALRPEQPEVEPLEILNRDNPIDVTAVVEDEPKAEAPKADEPKAEAPKVDEPKAEEPKAEEPKAEEPKAAEPKAAEPADVDDDEGPGAGMSLADLANPDDSEIDKPTRRPSARGSLLEQLRGRSVLRKKNPTGTSRVAAPPRPDAPPRPSED